MNILIVSDIHGSKKASEKIVSLDNNFNFKKIWILGDIGYSGARNIPPFDYSPIDVFSNLQKVKNKCLFIKGNCDSRVDEFVLKKRFYNKKILNLNGHTFFLTHGDLITKNDLDISFDVFIYGHTHIYELIKDKNKYFINPGSISLPKENKEKTYMIYDTLNDIISLYDINDSLIESIKIE